MSAPGDDDDSLAPDGAPASPNGSNSDLSSGTSGSNNVDGGSVSSGTSGSNNTADDGSEVQSIGENNNRTAVAAVNDALIDFLDGVLNEHLPEQQNGVVVQQAHDAAQSSPYAFALFELFLLWAYFLSGAGDYLNMIFGVALSYLVYTQASQLYKHVKTDIVGEEYNKFSYALIFLLVCTIIPLLIIYYRAGFPLWVISVPSIAYNLLHRVTKIIAEKWNCSKAKVYRRVLFTASSTLLGARFLFFDNHWGKGDFLVIFSAFVALAGFSFSANSKEFMLFCLVGGTAATAIGISILLDHPCTVCAWNGFTNAQPLFSDYFGSNAAKPISQIWHILVDDSASGIPRECGTCFETLSALHHAAQDTTKPLLSGYEAAFGAYEYFFGGPEALSLPTSVDKVEVGDFEDGITSGKLRLWNQWHEELLDQEGVSLSNVESFFVALASNITTCDGQGKLNKAVHDFLCKSTSRASGGPSPSEFVMQLQTPRYTGEASETGRPMNLSMNELKRVIRADDMTELGSPTCFMQVFVNALSPNMNVESEKMDPSNIAPIANEEQLRGADISFLFPALYVPRTDEDRDPTGKNGDVAEGAFALYRQLPMIDPDHVFLKSKEGYISWFRWNIEHKLQDEFYFPKWLSNGIESTQNLELYNQREVAPIRKRLIKESGEIRSMHFEYRADRLSLTDASSDETLSDRAFFGSGSKRMARIQLPGDSQYGFLLDSSYYETQAERDAFDLTKMMPKEYHFEHMAKHFWGEYVPLEKLRKKFYHRVVQVDYMEISFVDTRQSFERNGSILYLDVRTRKPMGIWLANTQEMKLPSDDPSFCAKNPGDSHACPWEHAKFVHRCTELTLIAMRHAGEYHIGYANVLSTAIRQTLPEFHPLRAFLKPYTHGTGTVDWVANHMLLQDHSVLHRASGFTRRARGFAYGTFQKHMNYTETLPEELKAKKLNGMIPTIMNKKPSLTSALWKLDDITNTMPMFDGAKSNWKIHRSFVDKYLKAIYPSDADLAADTALYRFWNHIDTWGRHMDVCVCKMDSDIFFTEDQWPAFEATKTCLGLLNFEEKRACSAGKKNSGASYAQRREQWCKRAPNERKNVLHAWLESECISKEKGVRKTVWKSGGCEEKEMSEGEEAEECLSYEAYHMRSDMGLPSVINRSTLVDVLTKFIYEVTLGHEMAADNIPYMADPSYGGVRISKNIAARGNEILVDFATYIYGNVIAAATTIRSIPLLADWSELLVHWVDEYKVKEWSDEKRKELKKKIRMIHLNYKADLVHLSNKLMTQTLKRPKNEWAPYLNPATQAASIAV